MTMPKPVDLPGVEILAPITVSHADVLSPEAIDFIVDLQRAFNPRRKELLNAREERQRRLDAGERPDFLKETRHIRESEWTVAPVPADLADRRVEITGPVDRKMIINALNSGAKVFMADFEDSTAPTLESLVEGQFNLRDAVAGTIVFTSPEGKHYEVKPNPAVLMVRPRGWHLPEKQFIVEGEPMSGALLDLGLFAFHDARPLATRDRGPYFYLPKMQSHREAALWNDVLGHIETVLKLPPGSMKVTVLIETLPAVFEMDEILWALRTRITGLNCGRWDYIFSYIKTLRTHRDRVLPERGQVLMTVPFLKMYSELLIRTCHRRGAFAMGGMAAQIPINNDPAANEAALAKVRADKLREVTAGHDGTWVAHPALVPIAREIFDAHMPAPNQLHVLRADVRATSDELLAPSIGTITRAGFEGNVEVCLRYLAAWLDGLGCVPIHHLMEDAATAEISRTQLWQWLHVGALALADGGTPIDFPLFDATLATVRQRLAAAPMPGENRLARAAELLGELTHASSLADFLTLAAYPELP